MNSQKVRKKADKTPTVPKLLMPHDLAVRMLRTLTGSQLKKATLWEIAAVIEQLAKKAGLPTEQA